MRQRARDSHEDVLWVMDMKTAALKMIHRSLDLLREGMQHPDHACCICDPCNWCKSVSELLREAK